LSQILNVTTVDKNLDSRQTKNFLTVTLSIKLACLTFLNFKQFREILQNLETSKSYF